MTVRADMVNGHDIGHGGSRSRSPTRRSRSPATPTTGARWRPAPRSGSAPPPGSATSWSPPPSSAPARAGTGRTTSRSPPARPSSPRSSGRSREIGGVLVARRRGGGLTWPARSRPRPARSSRSSSSSGCATPCTAPYEQRAALPARLRRGRRHARTTCAALADLARFPFTDQGRPARELPVRHVRGPARAGRAGCTPAAAPPGKPTVVGYTARGPRHLGRADGALDPGGRRPTGRPGARRLRLRPVHRRARRPLRRRAARLHGRAGQRRHDRAAGPADRRLPAAGDHGDAVVLPRDPRRDGGPGRRPARHLPGDRHLRGRAVDRRDAAGGRGALRASGPSTSTGSRR